MSAFEHLPDVRSRADAGSEFGGVATQGTRLALYVKLLLLDCVLLSTGLIMVGLLLGNLWRPYSGFGAVMLLLPPYLLFGFYNGVYGIDVLRRPYEGVRRALGALVLAIFTVLLVAFLAQQGGVISRLTFAAGTAVSALLLGGGRALFGRHVRATTGGELMNELLLAEARPAHERPGTVVVEPSRIGLTPDINDPAMLHRFGIVTRGFDRVVIDCQPQHRAAWALMLKGADVDGEILVEQFNDLGAIAICKFDDADTLLVSRRALSLPDRAKKRALDLAVTVPLLVALLPVLAVVALAVKLSSPGPILFRQDRVGRGNRMFRVLKFRSMRAELTDANGSRSVSRDDNRITAVGRIIRKTSIDELPQFFNVLVGDMSLVGPRPHALGSLAGERLFWEVDQTYWHRHRLKPGITGLAQVRGFRGATYRSEDLTNRLQADLEYIEGWSLWRDVQILLHTLRVVVHRNAY